MRHHHLFILICSLLLSLWISPLNSEFSNAADFINDLNHYSIAYHFQLERDQEKFDKIFQETPERLVSMKTADQQDYTCVLPKAETKNQRKIEEYTGPTPFELLKPLVDEREISIYGGSGYWFYEVAHGRFIRQYHDDKDTKQTIEFILGTYRHDQAIEDIKNFDQLNPPKTKINNVEYPYFPVHYRNGGTPCDLTGKPRTTTLLYICYELVLNQSNTIDHVLQTFLELRFHSDVFVCHERDYVMFELFTLRHDCVGEYLNLLLQSENHFHLATKVLCSNLLSDEMFIVTFGKTLSNQSSSSDGKFVKFLTKSESGSMVFEKIKKIANARTENMDEIASQLTVILTKLFQHRAFRSSGIQFVLELFTHFKTKNDGYLKTLVSAFIICFVNGHNSEQTNFTLATEFFQNLHNLIIKNMDEFSSFNEFLLLLAIHFQSLVESYETRSSNKHEARELNEEELNKLLSTALGFKVQTGYNRYTDIAKIFLRYGVLERDIVELASRISVTFKLNSHVTGYLPVHCIDYLLNNRSFSRFSISIEDWLQKQILECCSPIHPIVVSIIRKYATSCVAFDENIVNCNKKINETFFRDLFSRNVLIEKNVVPYLLSFYFVIVYNSTAIQAPPQRSIMTPHSSTKLYSSDLVSLIPIRHLISLMDETPELYQNLRTKIQIFSVENQFHMIPTIEDDLRKSTNEMFFNFHHHRGEETSENELYVPQIKNVMELIQNLPKNYQSCIKMIQKLKKLSAEQLATDFYKPIAFLMFKTLETENLFHQKILNQIIPLFNNIETIVPQRLYVETLKYWFSNGDSKIKLALIEHDFMVQEPTRVLRVDPRVLKSPKHFQILLNILDFYLKALRSYQKAIKVKYLSKFNNEKALSKAHDEINVMQNAASECQYSLAIHLLLEISDETENSCESIIEIRQLSMGFIQKIFLTAPNVILTVHYQGYPLKYIPYMVELVPSIFVMVEHMDELIRHCDISRRIFGIYLISNIVISLPMPKHVHLAQMILLVIENQMAFLETHEKVLFLLKILPALELMAKKLEFAREGIIGIIQKGIKICQSRASINSSLTLARKQPEKIAITAAKESIERIKNLPNPE